jgi:hypothetical protein
VADNNIKIPAKHYVGMVKRQTEKIPLGFITPWGEDAAAKKRIATVDNWSKQRHYSNQSLPSMVIDNVPLNGFKMTTDIRSSSYGGVDKWRIEDPRGFELEITSYNLAQLLTVGMIDRGEILDRCVWARSGQQNVLLSTETDEYKAAVENTNVAAMTAEWKDVKIGNTVLLQNNVTGVWLGRMHGVYLNGSYYRDEDKTKNQLAVTDKSMHVIFVKKTEENKKDKLILVNSPKLAAITDNSTKTDNEAEELVNQLLSDSNCQIENSGYKDYLALTIGAPKLGSTATMSLKQISIESEEVLEQKTYYRGKYHVYQATDHFLYKITSTKDYSTNRPKFTCYSYDKKLYLEDKIVPVGSIKSDGGYWNKRNYWQQSTHDYEFKENDVFYTVVLTVKTKAGTTIETFLR